MSTRIYTEDGGQLKFLGRAALLFALAHVAAVLVLVLGIVSMHATSSTYPEEFEGLDMALNNAYLYRLAMTLDGVTWLAAGAFLITFAVVLVRRAPIRSAFIAGCGVAQVLGMIDTAFTVRGFMELAGRWSAATADQQAALLASYQDVDLVMDSLFTTHWTLFCLAFLLAASVTWSLATFPRWLSIGLALIGIIGVVDQAIQFLAGNQELGFLIMSVYLLQVLVLPSMAWVFWRRTRGRLPDVNAAPAG